MGTKLLGAACCVALGLWAADAQAATTLIFSQSGGLSQAGEVSFGVPLPGPGDYILSLQVSQPVYIWEVGIQATYDEEDYCGVPGTSSYGYCGGDDFPVYDIGHGVDQQTAQNVTVNETVPAPSYSDFEDVFWEQPTAILDFDNFTGTSMTGAPVTYTFDVFSVDVVPEPATWLLSILGLGLIGAALRVKAARRPVPRRPAALPIC